jgi:GrpB-like predicted nucleotidyltransferase (UPF0157 family)
MNGEEIFVLVETEQARGAAQALFNSLLPILTARLPSSAEIRHIGATAVPGCLTKGDLDIVVRVPPEDFSRADAALSKLFVRNLGSASTKDFSAFEDSTCHPPLGVQLTAIGGEFDGFHQFVDALLASPQLVAAYNALKRGCHGGTMANYRKAKDEFVARVLDKTAPL